MQSFTHLLVLLPFLLFLFLLFVMTHEDFVFLRRSVTTEQVFDMAFLSGLAALLSARLLFVVLNFEQRFLNPFTFLLFPYSPGLSLAGGVFGGLLFVVLYSLKKRMPAARLFDFFATSLLFCLATTFALLTGWGVILQKAALTPIALLPLSYSVAAVFFIAMLLPLKQRNVVEEGSLGLLFLLFFSCILFIQNLLSKQPTFLIFSSAEDGILIVVFVFSLALLIRQEKLLSLFRKI